jgi:glycosyltransferase involved in cell wall biosynthesis
MTPQDDRRLLLVAPWLEVGGADRFNLDLLRELQERGWTTSVVTTLVSEHPWKEEFEQYTNDITLMDRTTAPQDAPAAVADVLRTRAPTVVLVSQSEAGYLLLPYMRSVLPDVAFVDLCHSVAIGWMNGGYPRYSLDAGEHLDLRIVTSHDLERWMTQRGADATGIRVAYTNVDTERWSPAGDDRRALRAQIGIEDDLPVVFYAARLSEEKRPLLALEVIGDLLETHPVHCIIAGDGPLRTAAEGYVTRRGLGSAVTFEGAIPSDRVQQIMRAADVFFLPSAFEGIALTVFEAMSCGVCVVASDVGGQRELVTPDTGLLVSRGARERERFRDALETVVTDPAGGREMGERARLRVETSFRMSDMGERMDDLLSHATRTGRSPADTSRACEDSAKAASRYLELTWAHQRGNASQRLYAWTERRGWRWPSRLAARLRHRLIR